MKKYLVLALAVSGIFSAVMAEGNKVIKLENGSTIKVASPQKKGFPSPRTYTKYVGKMDGDSIFMSKNGKYCKILKSPKTGKEYAKWLKTE